MNKQALLWLYEELPNLVSKGVLTSATAEKLHEYYGELKSPNKTRFAVTICSILGALLIGLGIILLFAHNWEQLSRPLRTFLSLSPLMAGQALGFWVLLKHPASHTLKETAATFISLMVGAAITLISQTYNISGNIADFILSWALLIVPLTYLMATTIPALIYIFGISIWAFCYWDNPQQPIIFWPLLAVIIPHFVWSLHQNRYNFRTKILTVAIATSICFGMLYVAQDLNKIWNGSWIVIYSSIATLFYLLGKWKFSNISTNWQKPLDYFGTLGIFIMAISLTFRLTWDFLIGTPQSAAEWNLSWLLLANCFLALLLVGTVILMFLRCVKQKKLVDSLFGFLPALTITGYCFSATSVTISTTLFNIFVFVVSTIQIKLGIKTNDLNIVNTGMLMLAALILARFFDSNVNFITKGLLFIVIGIGFLITNVMIIRRKKGIS